MENAGRPRLWRQIGRGGTMRGILSELGAAAAAYRGCRPGDSDVSRSVTSRQLIPNVLDYVFYFMH